MSDGEKTTDDSVKYYYENGKYRKILFSPLKKQGFIPEKGSELYVSNIPEDASVYDLAKFFEKAGKVFQIRLMMKSNNKQNRGFGYVTYMTKEYALTAIEELKDVPFFANVLLTMQKSVDNCRIFLGGVPLNKTKDEIWHELMSTYKISNIVDVITYRSYGNPSLNRGFVFLEFRTHEDASYFRAKYSGKLALWGKNLLVDWSIPVLEPEEEEMASVKIIYLRNLNVIQSSEDFNRQINQMIERRRVEKIYKFKDYSYIHLKTRKDAEWLMEVLKNYYKHTDVEITWAKPPNKFNDPMYRQKTLLTRRNFNFQEPLEVHHDERYYEEHTPKFAPPMGRPVLNMQSMVVPPVVPSRLPLPPQAWKTIEPSENRDLNEILKKEFPPLPSINRGDRFNRNSTSDSHSSSSYQSRSSHEEPGTSYVPLFEENQNITKTSKPFLLFDEVKSYNNIFELKNLYDIHSDMLQKAYGRAKEEGINDFRKSANLDSIGYKNGERLIFKEEGSDEDEQLEALTRAMVEKLLMD